MSYNGSGTFNINTSGQPVVAGTIISAATFNALTADLATGLTTALTKDGQTTATARIPFAQGINSTLVTDASSTSTGSIITAGGVGIAKKLYVGTDANIAGLTASSAVATDASKNLVSVTNTGTGSNVLATAPTIASLNLTTALTLASAAGTNGQVLTSAGSGLPSWTTPNSGALTFLSAVTASASATVDVETTFSSTYDTYLLTLTNVVSSVGDQIKVRFKLAGAYVTTTTYGYHVSIMTDGSTAYAAQAAAVGSAATGILLNDTNNGQLNMVMRVYAPSSNVAKQIDFQGTQRHNNSSRWATGTGINSGTGALTGIRFSVDSGNIASGTFRLYGIANS